MPRAQRSVTIDRSPETVFAYLANGENAREWRPGVLDIAHVSGEGVGATYRQGVSGPMNRRVDADYTVTAFEPDQRLAFQTIAGPVRPRGSYELEPADGGTRLTFTLEADLDWLRGLLMSRMVQQTMDAEVGNLDRLKERLESSGSEPPSAGTGGETAPADEAAPSA